jgi:hypothetical protein
MITYPLPRKALLMSLSLGILAAWGIRDLAQAQPWGITLRNVVTYYDGQPHQQRAVDLLQRQINQLDPDLLAADSIFANVWRNGDGLEGHIDILDTIATGDRTGSDPLQVALDQVGRDPGTATTVELLPAPGVENPDMAMVTITVSDLLDDSVTAQRYRFDLRRQNNTWEITRAGIQTRCQPGRGHQTWAGELCI